MGTKPVTRDDGKTVTGHVWTKDEEPTGCGCYPPVYPNMTYEQGAAYLQNWKATEEALKRVKPMTKEELTAKLVTARNEATAEVAKVLAEKGLSEEAFYKIEGLEEVEKRAAGEETERASENLEAIKEVLKTKPPIILDQRALTKGALMLATGLSSEEAETWMGNGEKWPATPAELDQFARQFFDRCLEVMRAKNARYAGEEDPFRNLRRGGVFGIAVRMDDKVSRMLTLSHPLNKLDGLDESIEDTAVDMANYAMLAIALYTHLMTPKINLGGK